MCGGRSDYATHNNNRFYRQDLDAKRVDLTYFHRPSPVFATRPAAAAAAARVPGDETRSSLPLLCRLPLTPASVLLELSPRGLRCVHNTFHLFETVAAPTLSLPTNTK
ncbi:hypothetical protein XENORESO_009508 [Xenotaenia resolanae]|uniref:Uncharacterized protein n=1 Tax=Xenotaenia resolanae TaxID=208358 RepID=A0ABV0VYP7_9TELE